MLFLLDLVAIRGLLIVTKRLNDWQRFGEVSENILASSIPRMSQKI